MTIDNHRYSEKQSNSYRCGRDGKGAAVAQLQKYHSMTNCCQEQLGRQRVKRPPTGQLEFAYRSSGRAHHPGDEEPVLCRGLDNADLDVDIIDIEELYMKKSSAIDPSEVPEPKSHNINPVPRS